MTRLLVSFLPFAVCFAWLIAFVLRYTKTDSSKKALTWFLATASCLYFCHGLYFNGIGSDLRESVWTLCSLSVYPLYYVYLKHLTQKPLKPLHVAIILLPGLLIAIARYAIPGEAADMARKSLNIMQIIPVCIFGYRDLTNFDKELEEMYADTEGRSTQTIKNVLVAFVCTSVLSAVANAIGKQYFLQSALHIFIILCPFAVLLFLLSYYGYKRPDFYSEQFQADSIDDEEPSPLATFGTSLSTDNMAESDSDAQDTPHVQDSHPVSPNDSDTQEGTSKNDTSENDKHESITPANEEEEKHYGNAIRHLILDERIYLRKNLKLADVASEVGVCRTYVSNYINKAYSRSFSDYVNSLRIEYAKQLLLDKQERKMSQVAEESGFSSEQSFYRNFKKFVGMNPNEWLSTPTNAGNTPSCQA